FRQRLEALIAAHPAVFDSVRGSGLMLGVKCKAINMDVVNAGYDTQVITVPAADHVIRILPPLTITDDEIGEAITRLDKSALAGCELYYFGAEGTDVDGDERVSLVIGRTEKPAVIVVGAYQETWWQFKFLPDANVRQVIVGGYYDQLAEGIPDDLPLAFQTYFPDHDRGFFYGHSPNTAEGRKTIGALQELTGLGVEHFYTIEKGEEFVLEPPAP
ncbi:MAG: aminotransferase class III-fold pyridoxal phosphate-dependent enzyme, partial [Planctomycetota bacterium]